VQAGDEAAPTRETSQHNDPSDSSKTPSGHLREAKKGYGLLYRREPAAEGASLDAQIKAALWVLRALRCVAAARTAPS